MSTRTFLAFDLGAESGRAIVGKLEHERLTLKEIYRFPNGPVRIHGHLHWDCYRLFEELKIGLQKAVADQGKLTSMGIDTWGVDFGLIGPDGALLGIPFAYRDPQTDGMVDRFLETIPRSEVYQRTGIQFQQFNSMIQLFAMRQRGLPMLTWASRLLFMPDLLTYFFTGIARTEFSIATTSQLYNPSLHGWDQELLRHLGLNPSVMQEIVEPGTPIGAISSDVADELHAPSLPVIAVATHDTGSAVAAVPASGEHWAYISSGTWSLMGIETRAPILTPKAMEANFTNEGGVDGTFRFLRNIMGLWLLQECRRAWNPEVRYTYDDLMTLAPQARALRSLIDPDWEGFYRPREMPEAICSYCRRTSQPVPDTHAAIVRCILESLALKYRSTLDDLRRASESRIDLVHIIGGGSRNSVLCQFTANATALPVLAGPAEATAIGNLMMQARAMGHVSSLQAMRAVIGDSWVPDRYEPEDTKIWEDAYNRFLSLQNPSDHEKRTLS